ncbi:MAG: PEP-CTERM sorting domain-containing protein [Phycisphaerae bacterium]|nr:PEP-CTERM sorting domain-containing protein [Phycisphaerae bacterium]
MCTKAMKPLWVISFVLLITAVLLVSAGPASAVSNVPDYRGDDNSVHAVFDWVSNPHIPWNTTLFETGFSIYNLDPTVPAASDNGLNTVIDLPNFIDPLSFKLMRIRMFFDGPVLGELIIAQVTAFDPEGPTLVSLVGSSGPGLAIEHYIDFEIFPNPDREQITILGNTGAGIIPGNLLQIEIDTVSLPEPATLAVLGLGLISVLIRRARKP